MHFSSGKKKIMRSNTILPSYFIN